MTQRGGQLRPQGLDFWEDFRRFFSCIDLYKHMTPWGMANLDPSSLTGRIYVGDY